MARHLPRNVVAAAAVGALIFSPLIATTSASATIPSSHVLFISNAAFSDVDEEDVQSIDSIEATGATVTVFDGGDASAGDWTTALTGIDIVVIPEAEAGSIYTPGGTAVMSDAAAAVLQAWVSAGGDIVGLGAYTHDELLSYLMGLDYSAVWSNSSTGGGWERQPVVSTSLPATIPSVNYSGGLYGFNTWSAPLLAPVTPLYLSADGTNLGIGSFALGSGSFIYVAYDWYPDVIEIGDGSRAIWDSILQSFFEAAPAAPPADDPELANTGADLSLVPLASGFLLLGLVVVMIAQAQRRKVA